MYQQCFPTTNYITTHLLSLFSSEQVVMHRSGSQREKLQSGGDKVWKNHVEYQADVLHENGK